MTRRLNRRTLIGGSMEIIGAAGFGSLAFAAEEEAAPSPPMLACGVAQLPYYTAVPWVHDGALYLFTL